VLFWLGTSPATLVHCCAARCCSRRACTYSGGDPEHCLIPISSCCGSRPSKAAISLRALVPIREVVFDSTVISKNFVQLLLRIFAEYFYSAFFLRSTFTPHFLRSTFTPHFLRSTFTPHFCGVLLLRNFAEYFYSTILRSTFSEARVNPIADDGQRR
jgi:hypothetical protein